MFSVGPVGESFLLQPGCKVHQDVVGYGEAGRDRVVAGGEMVRVEEKGGPANERFLQFALGFKRRPAVRLDAAAVADRSPVAGCEPLLQRIGNRCPGALLPVVVDRLNAPSAGRVILRGGHFQGCVVGQRLDDLHQPLSEGGRAEHDGPVEVLQGARHDFCGGGCDVADQHDQWEVRRDRRACAAIDPLVLEGSSARGYDYGALRDEQLRNLYCFVKETAGVVPQVDDESLQPFRFLQGLHRLAEFRACPTGKPVELDIPDARRRIRKSGKRYIFQRDLLAGQ